MKVFIFHVHFQTINHRVSEWARYFASRPDVDAVFVYYFFANPFYAQLGLSIPYDFGISKHPKIHWIELDQSICRTESTFILKLEPLILKVIGGIELASAPRRYFLKPRKNVIHSMLVFAVFPILYLMSILRFLWQPTEKLFFTKCFLRRVQLIISRHQNEGLCQPRPKDIIVATNLWTLQSVANLKKDYPYARAFYDPMEVVFDMWGGNKFSIAHWVSKRSLSRFEKISIRVFDFVVAVSPQMCDLYKGTYDGHSNYIDIPNAFYFQGFSLPQPEPGTVKFVIQMSYTGERGLLEFVEIFRRADYKGATLTVRIPFCPEGITKYLRTVPSVIIENPIKGEDNLTPSLLGFDVGVIPYLPDTSLNHKICCPNKFFQYMNAGLAVLSTQTEFLSQMINERRIGYLYNPYKRDEAIKVIHQICLDTVELKSRKKRAYELASSVYNNSLWKNRLDSCLPIHSESVSP